MKIKRTKEEILEDRKASKAFNELLRRARRKGALLELIPSPKKNQS